MNKALTSLNTFFLILLFLSLIFSMFSIPNLNIDETQSIKVNFYEPYNRIPSEFKIFIFFYYFFGLNLKQYLGKKIRFF